MYHKEGQRSHWSGYRLLHVGQDPHRGREARYYLLPGDFAHIGYSDGTDSFIIPVSEFVLREVREALEKISRGEDFKYTPPAERKRRVMHDPADEAPTRHRRVFHG